LSSLLLLWGYNSGIESWLSEQYPSI
jgi:hypothetical protein